MKPEEVQANPYIRKDELERDKIAEIIESNGLGGVPQDIRERVFNACRDVLKWKNEQVQGFLFSDTIYTAPTGMLEGLGDLNDKVNSRWIDYQAGIIKDYNDCDAHIMAVRRANATISTDGKFF